jgi:hypothetical protein
MGFKWSAVWQGVKVAHKAGVTTAALEAIKRRKQAPSEVPAEVPGVALEAKPEAPALVVVRLAKLMTIAGKDSIGKYLKGALTAAFGVAPPVLVLDPDLSLMLFGVDGRPLVPGRRVPSFREFRAWQVEAIEAIGRAEAAASDQASRAALAAARNSLLRIEPEGLGTSERWSQGE